MKGRLSSEDLTLLDMLPSDQAVQVKEAMGGRRSSYAFGPNTVLEPSYKNPHVRRWHRRDDQKGEKEFQRAIAPLVRASKDDLATFARALSSDELGLFPGNYAWSFHDGVYRPGDENIVFDSDLAPEYWGDVIGETDPLKIIPKALGVTTPGQINARLAGTAFPALRPKLDSIVIGKGSIGVTSDFMDGTDGFVKRSFLLHGDEYDSPHLGMSLLEIPNDMVGHGYGLAVHASNNAWARDIGLETSMVDVAIDVGSYVWPLIGYDNKSEVGKVLKTLSRKMGQRGQDVGVFDLRDEQGFDSLPKIARHPAGKEALLNHALIELKQSTSGNEYFQEIAELRAQDIMEGNR